jgi:hypothetical protein
MAQQALERQSQDFEYLKEVYKKLERSSYQIAEAMYQLASADGDGY